MMQKKSRAIFPQSKQNRSALLQTLIRKLMAPNSIWGVTNILEKSVALRCANDILNDSKEGGHPIGLSEGMQPDENTVSEKNDVVQDVINFFSTIGLVSALLLTVTIQWLFTPLTPSEVVYLDQRLKIFRNFYNCTEEPCTSLDIEHAYKEALNVAFVGCMFLATSLSIVALLYSVLLQIHLTVCMVTREDKLWFIENVNITAPRDHMLAGLAFLGLSIPLGLVVVYGRIVCWVCAFLIAIILLRVRSFLRELCRLEFAQMKGVYCFRADELQKLADKEGSADRSRDDNPNECHTNNRE